MSERIKDTLDLKKNKLFVFEPFVYDTIIYSIYRGIIKGIPIDPVPVALIDGSYYLTQMMNCRFSEEFILDGGHHRAFAHYMLGVPLPVIVMPENYAAFRNSSEHISTISVEEDTRNTEYKAGKDIGKKYLPLDGFKRPLNLEKLAGEFKCKRQLH